MTAELKDSSLMKHLNITGITNVTCQQQMPSEPLTPWNSSPVASMHPCRINLTLSALSHCNQRNHHKVMTLAIHKAMQHMLSHSCCLMFNPHLESLPNHTAHTLPRVQQRNTQKTALSTPGTQVPLPDPKPGNCTQQAPSLAKSFTASTVKVKQKNISLWRISTRSNMQMVTMKTSQQWKH